MATKKTTKKAAKKSSGEEVDILAQVQSIRG